MPPVCLRAAYCSSSVSSFRVIGCWRRAGNTETLGKREAHPHCSTSSLLCSILNLLASFSAACVPFSLFLVLHAAADEDSMFQLIIFSLEGKPEKYMSLVTAKISSCSVVNVQCFYVFSDGFVVEGTAKQPCSPELEIKPQCIFSHYGY